MTDPLKYFDYGILAIDPATRIGYAYLDGNHLISGSWSLAVTSNDSWGLRAWRLFGWLMERASQALPALIVYEKAALGSHVMETTYFHGLLAGAIEVAAGQLGIPTKVVNPRLIKSFATGNWNAKKDQVMRACRLHYGIDCGQDNNRADAIMLLGLATREARGHGQIEVPKRRLKGRRKSKVITPRLFK